MLALPLPQSCPHAVRAEPRMSAAQLVCGVLAL